MSLLRKKNTATSTATAFLLALGSTMLLLCAVALMIYNQLLPQTASVFLPELCMALGVFLSVVITGKGLGKKTVPIGAGVLVCWVVALLLLRLLTGGSENFTSWFIRKSVVLFVSAALGVLLSMGKKRRRKKHR